MSGNDSKTKTHSIPVLAEIIGIDTNLDFPSLWYFYATWMFFGNVPTKESKHGI